MKRFIGQNFDSDEIQHFKNRCIYKITNDENMIQIVLDGIEYYPEEISSRILMCLKNTAEKFAKKTVTDAVITVPAYFGGSQRDATKAAAHLADFKNVRVINEPTAAALAFLHNNPKNQNRIILIYDFGGGTFDVTVAETIGKKCKVLATNGCCFLGGTDIDMNIVNYIKENIDRQIPEFDARTHRRLKNIAEDAKKYLSSHPIYEVDLFGKSVFISRKHFERMNLSLFSKTIDIAIQCVKDAGLELKDIDEIVPIGGSTRIPKVLEMLQQAFKSSHIARTINPDQAVAYGAALYATNIFEKKASIIISDVLSLSLGIEIKLGEMYFIFKRNTPIPCEHTETFKVDASNFTIKLYQGESLVAKDNHFLGQCTISELHLIPSISIAFSFDKDGILTVRAQSSSQIQLKIDMTKHKVNDQKLTRLLSYKDKSESELKYLKFARNKQEFDYYCENLQLQLQNHHRRKKIMEKIYKYRKMITKFTPEDSHRFTEFMKKLDELYTKPRAIARFLKNLGIEK